MTHRSLCKMVHAGQNLLINFQVRVISGGEGKCVFEMTVCEEHRNRMGVLHGGMTATLVDSLSTMALVSAGAPPGVSVDLNVS